MRRSLAFGTLLILAAPALVWANMADPHRPGDPIGEPSAALAGLVVEHESLRVDLRAETVEAVYTIRNDSAAREVDLAFLALGLAEVYDDSLGTVLAPGEGRYTVELDGAAVPAQATDSLLVPSVWVTGEVRTPEIGGGLAEYRTAIPPVYGAAPEDTVRYAPGFRFRLAIPAGRHEVRVRYPVTLARYEDPGHPNALRQFAYSLAPARRWGGVGRLDVEVLLPPGVEAASAPALTRTEGRLAGSFDGLPADVLTVSFRQPAPLTFHVAPVLAWGWLALCVLVAPIAWGRRIGRAGVLGSLGRGALAAVLGVVGFALLYGLSAMGAETAYGYGFVFAAFFLAIPAMLLGALLYAVLEQVAGRWRSAPAGGTASGAGAS